MSLERLPDLDYSQFGRLLFEREHIWQMRLLDAGGLSRFAKDRGVNFSTDDISRLWQLCLIKAELVVSTKRFQRAGLEYLGRDERERYVYADTRTLRPRKSGWRDAAVKLRPLPKEVKLYFHPFRYYVLYHLDRILTSHVSKMQLFVTKYYHKTVDTWLSFILPWSASAGAIDALNKWNGIATLAVIAEPYSFSRVYGKEIIRGFIDEKVFRHDRNKHWDEASIIYRTFGSELLEQIMDALCVDADYLDRNENIYAVLRLADGDTRLKLEGRLGGAVLLRSMAEIVRRAVEKLYAVELREEDERGLGWMIPGVKLQLYGGNRIFDGDRAVANNYLRHFRLDFGVKVHWYVEGDTEYGALYNVFEQHGATGVQIVNLQGQFVQKGGTLSFREGLEADMRAKRFSFISLDADVDDNMRVVRRAAQDDVICGMVYVATPDFEFENFSIDELEEVLWEMAVDNGALLDERVALHAALRSVTTGKELWTKAQRALPILKGSGKSKDWGERLIRYAGKQPDRQDGARRPIIDAIHVAFKAASFDNYGMSRERNRIDPNSLKLVKRESNY